MGQFQTHDLFFLQTGIEQQVNEAMAAWIFRCRLQQTLDLIIKQQLRQRRQRAFKGQARGGIFTNDLLTEQPGKEVFEKGNTSCHSFGSRYLSQKLLDRKSTRLNSSHQIISYAVFCLKKKT